MWLVQAGDKSSWKIIKCCHRQATKRHCIFVCHCHAAGYTRRGIFIDHSGVLVGHDISKMDQTNDTVGGDYISVTEWWACFSRVQSHLYLFKIVTQ
jgi:hypothetical protein